MAQKDWASAGITDLTQFENYDRIFRSSNGLLYLDSYNLDALDCNGSFDGQL